MNKFFLTLISALLIFSLVGCDSNEPGSDEVAPPIQTPSEKDDNTSTENPETPDEESDTDKAGDETTDQPDTSDTTDTTKPETPDSSNNNSNNSNTEDTDEKTKEISSRLYFYDFEKEKIYYVDKAIEVINGGYVNALTNSLKYNQDNQDFITVNADTFVTSAKLDEEKGILSVYFNESFHLSTNLGSAIEVGFIDALVNTYAYNYNVEKVAIYVENKLFSDQRGEMPNGYFPVTFNEATAY